MSRITLDYVSFVLTIHHCSYLYTVAITVLMTVLLLPFRGFWLSLYRSHVKYALYRFMAFIVVCYILVKIGSPFMQECSIPGAQDTFMDSREPLKVNADTFGSSIASWDLWRMFYECFTTIYCLVGTAIGLLGIWTTSGFHQHNYNIGKLAKCYFYGRILSHLSLSLVRSVQEVFVSDILLSILQRNVPGNETGVTTSMLNIFPAMINEEITDIEALTRISFILFIMAWKPNVEHRDPMKSLQLQLFKIVLLYLSVTNILMGAIDFFVVPVYEPQITLVLGAFNLLQNY